jgi:glycerol-3-phosphate O-acyltransferase/dihydroxyacetone phosphate acyltransferase
MTLFRALSRIGTSLFFGRIEVDGEVPDRGPILIVSNHTNGLVDALVITAAIRRRVSLTAKSTLKKNPLLALVIWLADAVPLYRKQDGVEMAKNFDSFVEVKRRLRGGGAICIFPEGMSHSDASMREFRTGAARIALESRGIGLRIVPAGLHYDAKQRFREGLWLRWTAELLDTRGEDPRPLDQEERAYAARTRLIAELRDGYEKADRERVSSVIAELRRYRRDLRRLGIAQHEVFLSMHPLRALFFTIRELELLIVGGVIAAAGAVQHGVAFAIDRLLTKKLSVDLDQFASNAIFYGFAIFPLVWVCGIAAAWVLGSWRWALAYALAIPFTLLYTILWSDRIVRAARRARTFFLFLFRRGTQRELQERGRGLIARINELRETLT